MRASVIIATYNQARELGMALSALAGQTRAPEEVLVADDGSTEETRLVVQSWKDRLPFPVEHVWQEDRGYRKSAIINEAVRRSTGDQLIFIDGDSFPHRRWVEDHMAAADGRRILCGRRVKLGPRISGTLTPGLIGEGSFGLSHVPLLTSALTGDTKRILLGVRLPQLVARVFHPRPRKLMGVNFSMPREAFFEVNGYDEKWTFYGREDRDLELRLLRAGRPFYPLLNRAVVYHVYHPERERSEACESLIAQRETSTRVRCERGVAQTTKSV